MFKILPAISICVALIFQNCTSNLSANNISAASTSNDKGFAIIELFTSEGCSSCPPADKLAAEIAIKADKDQQDIFVLSEHVDYWNHIGWTDPFSLPFYSERQRWYADYFKDEGVYTPQMIINGQQPFVGSDRKAATAGIQSALNASSSAQPIILTADENSPGNYHYKIPALNKEESLNIVLVEKQASSKVLRGENMGRTLTHHNVVREWQTINNRQAEGSIKFKLQDLPDQHRFTLIAFIQNTQTKQISSAGILR